MRRSRDGLSRRLVARTVDRVNNQRIRRKGVDRHNQTEGRLLIRQCRNGGNWNCLQMEIQRNIIVITTSSIQIESQTALVEARGTVESQSWGNPGEHVGRIQRERIKT